jgi:hypothetical protein
MNIKHWFNVIRAIVRAFIPQPSESDSSQSEQSAEDIQTGIIVHDAVPCPKPNPTGIIVHD